MSEVLDRTSTPAPFWRSDVLTRHGGTTALVHGEEQVTYADLARRVAREADAWPGTGERRLVLVEIEPTVDSVVTYLAALEAGHVVLLTAPGRTDTVAQVWSPDDRAHLRDGRWVVSHGSAPGTHDLHPDLALLLSTSGSTGSPKLVRLSAGAVRTNAADIAAALGLDASDRAVTTLPLHYCYGLSVLHSHLAVGASVLLTDASVVDPELWASMRTAGVTSLAGVPHTFDLLESTGAPTGSVPTLRQITQAGGRLRPEQVRAWAVRGEREGWDLRVMYGQTEATARMAVSAPGQAAQDPSSVGRPVGAGRFSVRDAAGEVPACRVGDLHFTGSNVMLGYALVPGDLARGRDVTDLATGDLARLRPDGTLELVGRRSSFLKVNGVRVDVERVEELLAEAGVIALVGGSDEQLLALVVADGARDGIDTAQRATRTLVASTGLPPHRVGVVAVPALPHTPNGKLDRAAVGPTFDLLATTASSRPHGSSAAALVALYADLLARPDATPDSSFVDLGGDSLSYVELSLHLEDRLGPLPADWPLRPIRALATTEPSRRRRLARVDTTIVLRALAILAIVGSHTHVVHVLGGAHILLGVAGFNFARFAATAPTVAEPWRRVGGTIARIAIPTFVWVAAVGLLAGTYSVANLVMANWLFGSDTWSSTWRLWFLEAVLWLVAIGWAAQVAASRRQRLLLSAVVALTLPGFMGDPVREATIAAGLLLVVWVRTIPVPRLLVPVLAVLASASLYIYLTHFEVYRATGVPLVNLGLGLGLGLATWCVTARLTARLGTWRLRHRTTTHPPGSRLTPRSLQEVPR